MYNEFVISLSLSVAFAILLSVLSQYNDNTLDLILDKAYYIYSRQSYFLCANNHLKWP